jgi:ferredoxin
MRVRVNEEACQGHTMCKMTAPDVFELKEDDGHSYVRIPQIPPELERSVRAAIAGCPERAIEEIAE